MKPVETVSTATRPALKVESAGPSADPIRQFCTACHGYPNPADFTMATWQVALDYKYTLFEEQYPDLAGLPSKKDVLDHYKRTAPQRVSRPVRYPDSSVKERWKRRPAMPADRTMMVSDLFAVPGAGIVLVADLLGGVWQQGDEGDSQFLFQARYPSAVVAGDVDRDGSLAVIVGSLGTFTAEDSRAAHVVMRKLVRGRPREEVSLLPNLGRIADVALGDLDGDGFLDLVVADFGWQKTGSLTVYWNQKTVGRPYQASAKTVLDSGHGAVSVTLSDLDGDGGLDIACAFAQERELINAYKNQGGRRFKAEELFRASTPMWGFLGLKSIDLDGDGDQDLLHFNGDNLDAPKIAAFQGVYLLRNLGDGTFVNQLLASMPGVGDVSAGDYDGDGDMDLLAVANLPHNVEKTAGFAPVSLDGMLFVEQVRKGEWSVQSIERDGGCYSKIASVGKGKDVVALVGLFGVGWEIFDSETGGIELSKEPRCRTMHALEYVGLNGLNKVRSVDIPPEAADPTKRRRDLYYAYGRLVDAEPDMASHHDRLGVLALKFGHHQTALAALERAVKLDATDPVSRNNLANLLSAQGDDVKAIEVAQSALRIDPSYAVAHNTLAISLFQLRRIPEATASARRAVELDPGEPSFRANFIRCLLVGGELAEAATQLADLARRVPGYPELESLERYARELANSP